MPTLELQLCIEKGEKGGLEKSYTNDDINAKIFFLICSFGSIHTVSSSDLSYHIITWTTKKREDLTV